MLWLWRKRHNVMVCSSTVSSSRRSKAPSFILKRRIHRSGEWQFILETRADSVMNVCILPSHCLETLVIRGLCGGYDNCAHPSPVSVSWVSRSPWLVTSEWGPGWRQQPLSPRPVTQWLRWSSHSEPRRVQTSVGGWVEASVHMYTLYTPRCLPGQCECPLWPWLMGLISKLFPEPGPECQTWNPCPLSKGGQASSLSPPGKWWVRWKLEQMVMPIYDDRERHFSENILV